MSDEEEQMHRVGDRRANPPISMDVLAYQMGTFKESLDRGLGGLEKTIEKGLDAVASEVKELNGRVSSIERRQEYDAARLKALEQYRDEQDRIADDRRKRLEVDSDNSALWKTFRQLAVFGGGLVAVIGTVVAIIVAVST